MNKKWEYGKLKDAVDRGSSNISLNKIKGEDGKYPVFAARGFVQNVSFYHQENEYLGIIKDGAGIGRVSKYPAKSSIVATMQYLIPKEGFDIDFIRYFLEGIDFEKHRSGSTIPHIYFKDYKSEKFPKLSLPEQQRIVSILDHCFEAIDKAKANAEQNLQNAKELFESYLQGVFEKKGDGWEEKKLGKICDFVRGPFGGSLKKSIFKPEGYAVYEQRHAIYNQFDNVRYFVDDEKFNEMKRFELKPGNLIMSCSGTMGKIAIAPEGIKKGIINQALLKLAPSAKITPYYLKYWMESESFQDSLKEYSGGAAIQNVASVKILKQIVINVPSLSIQDEVVKKLDDMYEETQRLEIHYQKRIDDLEELKKSILQKAFAGELKTEKMVEEMEEVEL